MTTPDNGKGSKQTTEEKLHREIESLQTQLRLLKFRACRSEEVNKKCDLTVKKMEQSKAQLKEQSQMIVNDMEQVIFAILTSLKAFQAESRTTVFNLQTQLHSSEHQLLEANETISKLKEKVNNLETTLLENRRLYEISLQSIHITYVNCIEKIFEKLQTSILTDLEHMVPVNDALHELYAEKFKALNLPYSFDKI
ncbi:unnamed protein product [Hymenolepis diminuta]|uniref:Uncharacterized protein n=2 Tax=Hymenolepis diminuta TaxID=6216 RepID=A0A564YVR2_HYMDI|nr:unnamed protein product [Hymenolepis diminuta]